MPALQSLVLTDRTPVTPVNRTFVPRDIVGGVGTVVFNAGVPIGEQRATVSMSKKSSRYVGEVRLTLPVVVNETINGVVVPKVARTAYAVCIFTFDETASLQERTDAVGMMSSALGTSKVLVSDALLNLEGVY